MPNTAKPGIMANGQQYDFDLEGTALENYSYIVMLLLMFGAMYFFMIRPENKKRKDAEKMRSSLAVGDEITTIGGITGTICAVKENTVVFETGADRVRIEVTKWAISTKGTDASGK